MLSWGLDLPLRICLVCCRSDAVQSVWTFIATAFFSRRKFAFFKAKMSPALLSDWEQIYFMALLHFPRDKYVREDKMRQFTYLC